MAAESDRRPLSGARQGENRGPSPDGAPFTSTLGRTVREDGGQEGNPQGLPQRR